MQQPDQLGRAAGARRQRLVKMLQVMQRSFCGKYIPVKHGIEIGQAMRLRLFTKRPVGNLPEHGMLESGSGIHTVNLSQKFG